MNPANLPFDSEAMLQGLKSWVECESPTWDAAAVERMHDLAAPDKAIAEIARTLKPGGAHIMSVPIVNKDRPATRRAALQDGKVVHFAEPEYHGNPVDDEGSLVTIDWGYDIADFLHHHSGMPTSMFVIDDLSQGIRAEYIEIVVSRKGSVPQL